MSNLDSNVAHRRRGFTLVEILVVVIVLGILGAMVIPMFAASTDEARRATFVTSMQTHCNAFRLYHLKEEDWPADRTPAVMPPGMAPYLREDAWTADTPIGGQWDWDYLQFGYTAGVSVFSPNANDVEMAQVDSLFDDGNLATGHFRKRAQGYIRVIRD